MSNPGGGFKAPFAAASGARSSPALATMVTAQRPWPVPCGVPVMVETLAVPVHVEAARQHAARMAMQAPTQNADSRGVASWRSMALPVPRAMSMETLPVPLAPTSSPVEVNARTRESARSPYRGRPCAQPGPAATPQPGSSTPLHPIPQVTFKDNSKMLLGAQAAPAQSATPSRLAPSVAAAAPQMAPATPSVPLERAPSKREKVPPLNVASLTKPPAKLPRALEQEFEVDGSDLLGSGSFAVIQRLRQRNSGKLAALKVVEKYPLHIREMLPQLKREVKIQGQLKHRHILQLHSCLEDDNYVYMLLEYCAGGSLWELCARMPSRRLAETRASLYFMQILSAVDHMHRHGCIHRDLKTENMLLTRNDEEIRICDFGWSAEVQIERALRTTCGTPKFWAPEIFDGVPQTSAVDLWALGTLLYELLVGHAPFWGNNDELRRKVLAVDVRYPPGLLSTEAVDILHCLMQKEPKRRVPAGKLLSEHQWLQLRQMPGSARFRSGTASPPAHAPSAARPRGVSRRAQSVDVERNVVTAARDVRAIPRTVRDSWHYV
mmetsp:Transcript_25731/g.60047  ORF Transcript_25731/g.60047 Transcript_25731/m.60047 type:complete len:550 (+) Transcript_25731:2-1651(+)